MWAEILSPSTGSILSSDVIYKHQFKVKIIRNYKTATAECQPNSEPFWELDPKDSGNHMPLKPALINNEYASASENTKYHINVKQ